jgi:hypothetical protein
MFGKQPSQDLGFGLHITNVEAGEILNAVCSRNLEVCYKFTHKGRTPEVGQLLLFT